MKKIIFAVLILLIPQICFAAYDSRDLTRQRTSGWINAGQTNYAVKSTEGKIFTVTVTATTAGGYVEIFDAVSAPSETGQMIDESKLLVELYDGLVSDSKFVMYNPYLQATEGIMVTTVNAEAIITYY